MPLSFKPIWFDSIGAKSACTLVKTPDVKIVLEPGVAIMHSKFPASPEQMGEWLTRGNEEIYQACKDADILVISHYHYDHYIYDDMNFYWGKTVITKNPNIFINNSQRERALEFFQSLATFYEVEFNLIENEEKRTFPNPLDFIPIAATKDYGDYNKRKKQLLQKGLKNFKEKIRLWNSSPQIQPITAEKIKVRFGDGKTFDFGDTKLRLTKPMFHGIEFSSPGWVFASVVEHNEKKLLHTSDLCGPMIEDYAEWIIRENPDYLIMDGPMTYMFGYILTKINLQRCIENAIRIVEKVDAEVIIYDHHLPREARFRERTAEVWEAARTNDKKLVTAAEYLGKKTVAEN